MNYNLIINIRYRHDVLTEYGGHFGEKESQQKD